MIRRVCALLAVYAGLVLARTAVQNADRHTAFTVPEGKDLFIAFTAKWCGYCVQFKPHFEDAARQLIKEFPDKYLFYRSDIDEQPELSGRFLITSLPSVFHVSHNETRLLKEFPRVSHKIVPYITGKEYMTAEPTNAWLAPNSVAAKVLGFTMRIGSFLVEHAKMARAVMPDNALYAGAAAVFLAAVAAMLCLAPATKKRASSKKND